MRAWLVATLILACTSDAQRVAPVGSRAVAVLARHPFRAATLNGEIGARVPTTSGGALRIEAPHDPGVALELAPLGLRDVRAVVQDKLRVFEEIAPSTDLVYVVERSAVEDLRVVHGGDAAILTLQWRARLGADLAALRVRAGSFEALDARGQIRLATDEVIAVDARGTRRTLKLEAAPREGSEVLLTATLDAAELTRPIVIDPVWRVVGEMTGNVGGAVAVVLDSGKVLSVGGCPFSPNRSASSSNAQLYDPGTNVWTATTSMNRLRCGPTITKLTSGKVLAIGGGPSWGEDQASAEIYDPTTATWTLTTPPPRAFGGHTATLLTSGKVFIASNPGSYLFDPVAGTWSAGPPLLRGRENHAAVRLASGKVLIVGGEYVETFIYAVAKCELYDPATSTITAAGDLSAPRPLLAATLLPSGKVLVTGGGAWYTPTYSLAELFDETTKTWSFAPSSPTRHAGHVALLYGAPKPRVLITSGVEQVGKDPGNVATEAFDPTTSTWSTQLPLPFAFPRPTFGVKLLDGSVLIGPGSRNSNVTLRFEAKCLVASDCASGFCVDGVCCDKGCTGSCEACDVAGSVGACKAISGPPRQGHATCGPYLCSGGVCTTACKTSDDCLSAGPCTAGTCIVQKKNGLKCVADNECTSGFCIDDVCCESACGEVCNQCDVPGKEGMCSSIKGPPRPGKRVACGKDPQCGPQCEDIWGDYCGAAPAPGTACGRATCTDGVERHAGTCKSETCDGAAIPCTPYGCGATKCRTDCTVDSECASGFFCNPKSRCVGESAGCSEDFASAIDPTTGALRPCAPYRCRAGVCRTACTATGDCIAPATCEAKRCVTPTEPPIDDAGTDTLSADTSSPVVDSATAESGPRSEAREDPRSLYGCGVAPGRGARPSDGLVGLIALALVQRRLRSVLRNATARRT